MISLKNAPRWLSVANALTGALFWLPVLMLFYGYKGVSMGDFFLIQGIASLMVFVLEVPSGYIGDIFSRKNTVVIGILAYAIGQIVWIFGYGFWCILLGEIIFSAAISLISGTLDAYFYDLLKKRRKEGAYHRKYAKMNMFQNLVLAISCFTGAFFYQFYGPLVPVVLTLICMVAALLICLMLPDVPESKRVVEENKSKWKDILDISKFAIKHSEIKWLMLFPAIYGLLTFILLWGLQSVMIVRDLPIFVFSLVIGINAVMRSGWSSISGFILERFNLSGSIKLQCLIIVAAMLSACVAEYVSVFGVYLCLGMMIVGCSSIVCTQISTSVLINHRIKSQERATVLSVSSMINRLFWGGGLLCLKPLFEEVGIAKAFMSMSLLLIPLLICGYNLYRMKLSTLKS